MKTIIVILCLFASVAWGAENKFLYEPYERPLWKIVVPPTYSLKFHGEKGEVGTLSWETEELQFTGEADESARIFFEYFLKQYVDGYIKEKCNGKVMGIE